MSTSPVTCPYIVDIWEAFHRKDGFCVTSFIKHCLSRAPAGSCDLFIHDDAMTWKVSTFLTVAKGVHR